MSQRWSMKGKLERLVYLLFILWLGKNHADRVAGHLAKCQPLFPILPKSINFLPRSVFISLQTCFLRSPRTAGGGDRLGRADGRCQHVSAGLRRASYFSSRVPLSVSASAETCLYRLSGPQQFPGSGSILLRNEVVEDWVDGCT